MIYENLDDIKEQNPLILDSNYKAMDIATSEEVKRGDVVYVNSSGELTKTATGNVLFGIVLDDMQANGVTAVLVNGSVNYSEVKHSNIDDIIFDLRSLGIYLKKGV